MRQKRKRKKRNNRGKMKKKKKEQLKLNCNCVFVQLRMRTAFPGSLLHPRTLPLAPDNAPPGPSPKFCLFSFLCLIFALFFFDARPQFHEKTSPERKKKCENGRKGEKSKIWAPPPPFGLPPEGRGRRGGEGGGYKFNYNENQKQ